MTRNAAAGTGAPRVRELLGRAEAAVQGVEAVVHLADHRREILRVQFCRPGVSIDVPLGQVVDNPLDAATVFPVQVVDRIQNVRESGHAVLLLSRVISAAVERLPVRGEKDRERPATLSGQRLYRLLVTTVDLQGGRPGLL